jgi:hypothetical protein
MGRVLNRFTFDMDILVDEMLTEAIISSSWYYVAGVCHGHNYPRNFPVTIFLYWFLMLHYRRSGADLYRLDAVSHSPIRAMVWYLKVRGLHLV